MRLLFVIIDGGGNVDPQLGVAAEALRRGHDVRVMAHDSVADRVAATGAAFRPFRRAPQSDTRSPETDLIRDWEARTRLGALQLASKRLALEPARAFAEDVHGELTAEPADVAVVDCLVPGAAFGAEAAGVPRVALVHLPYLFPAPGLPPPGFGLRPGRGPAGRLRDDLVLAVSPLALRPGLRQLNRVRADLGLDPMDGFFAFLDRAERVLVLSSPALDFRARRLPANVCYVGPVLPRPAPHRGHDRPVSDQPPLVLVSMSSTYMDQTQVLQKVIIALAALPVRALVTTGPAVDPASLAAPSNVSVVPFAPHAEVLPDAAAVVTHAGHGTAIAALAHGVPLVCIPMGRDQFDVAARVVAAGAGVRVKQSSRPSEIGKAVSSVLAESRYRQAAERLGEVIAAEPGASGAVGEIEAVGARRAD